MTIYTFDPNPCPRCMDNREYDPIEGVWYCENCSEWDYM